MTDEQRKEWQARLANCERMAEQAYDDMYEKAHSFSAATGYYSNAKDAFSGAIQAARELGLDEEVKRLEERLEHVKKVFRSQFS
jgi:predicted Rossmann fold nucleotide-binding protein DprA/Smf involved in DNA uptake